MLFEFRLSMFVKKIDTTVEWSEGSRWCVNILESHVYWKNILLISIQVSALDVVPAIRVRLSRLWSHFLACKCIEQWKYYILISDKCMLLCTNLRRNFSKTSYHKKYRRYKTKFGVKTNPAFHTFRLCMSVGIGIDKGRRLWNTQGTEYTRKSLSIQFTNYI